MKKILLLILACGVFVPLATVLAGGVQVAPPCETNVTNAPDVGATPVPTNCSKNPAITANPEATTQADKNAEYLEINWDLTKTSRNKPTKVTLTDPFCEISCAHSGYPCSGGETKDSTGFLAAANAQNANLRINDTVKIRNTKIGQTYEIMCCERKPIAGTDKYMCSDKVVYSEKINIVPETKLGPCGTTLKDEDIIKACSTNARAAANGLAKGWGKVQKLVNKVEGAVPVKGACTVLLQTVENGKNVLDKVTSSTGVAVDLQLAPDGAPRLGANIPDPSATLGVAVKEVKDANGKVIEKKEVVTGCIGK